MSEGILLDNDIVLKMSMYHAVEALVATTTVNGLGPTMLGVARFTLRSRVARSDRIRDREAVSASLELAINEIALKEPSDIEVQDAAELEARASDLGLELDTGESQLVAMLIRRAAPLLVSGDKRAIRALEQLNSQAITQRIACLEQLVSGVVRTDGHECLRVRVCAEPHADKALTAVFGCHSEVVTLAHVLEGLRSYINALRAEAGEVLLPSMDLSAIVTEKDSEGLL